MISRGTGRTAFEDCRRIAVELPYSLTVVGEGRSGFGVGLPGGGRRGHASTRGSVSARLGCTHVLVGKVETKAQEPISFGFIIRSEELLAEPLTPTRFVQ